METLQKWMETRYLKWQQEHGRISIRKWSDALGISYSLMNNLMSGTNKGTTYQTAYQLAKRLNDYSIFDLLDYPVPPLAGFSEEEQSIILGMLDKVMEQYTGSPPEEREKKLREIAESVNFTSSDSD